MIIIETLHHIASIIEHEREVLLSEWRKQVRELPAARDLDVPTLNDHLPNLLGELAIALRSGLDETIAEVLRDGSSPAHGLQRVNDSFDIEEVVAEYNILRDCIHDLVDRNGLSMQGRPFHVLNRVLDVAIGSAMQSFITCKTLEVRERREEYLAFVAHDLRTPLNAISLSARVLEMTLVKSKFDTPESTQMLKTLSRNVQYLEVLISKVIEENTYLETEIGQRLERRELDLWPLVEALILDLHPVSGTSSTRLVNVVPEEFVVYADAKLLRRIFQNLIANAISYTPRGEVVIGVQKVGDKGEVECFVRDNGAGIPADKCKAVFDKHSTDSARDGGLGLGLAIVMTFVEAHGGVVMLESELDVGSCFRFTLPGRSA